MAKITNEQIALKISRNSIIWNVALSIFKLIAGIYAKSSAMVSDSVHSISDVLSTFIVIIGIKMASKNSDKEHQYGHERMECVAAIILAFLLAATGAVIGWGGVKNIISGSYERLEIPGSLALIAAVISIVVKEAMYWYTRAGAKKIDSSVLMADAWHHRSDALSSIGSFAGILGAKLGFPIFDSIACVLICFFILKVAFDIFCGAVGKMTDKACDDEFVGKITQIVLSNESVLGIYQIKTRIFGDKIYIDLEINADGNLTLYEAHNIAEEVHDKIEFQFPAVKHCMVHINPCP